MKTANMTFNEVLPYLKRGVRVSRKGWNGKGMFIFQCQGKTIKKEKIEDIDFLPDSVKHYLSKQNLDVEFLPYLCMFTADKKIVNGWLASQTDILADDWEILGVFNNKYRVVNNKSHADLKNGDIITCLSVTFDGFYFCENNNGEHFFLTEDEIEPIIENE